MAIKTKRTQNNKFEWGPVSKVQYSNGLVHVHQKTRGLRGAFASLYVLVGSRDENQQNQGICHLLEHMVYRGGGGFGSNEILTRVEELGGDMNAYTSKEYTCFEVSCLSRKLKDVFPFLVELVLSPDFPESELKKEKKIVAQEVREDNQDHELMAEEALFEKCFDFGLGHSIGGKTSTIKNITTQELRRFYRKYFVPQRMVVVTTSGHDIKEFTPTIKELFERYRLVKNAAPLRRKLRKFPKELKTNKTRFLRDTEVASLIIGTAGATLDSPYRAELSVLNYYLTEGMSSRLYKVLREEEPLIYGLGTSVNCFTDNGNMVFTFSCTHANVDKIKKKFMDVFKDVAENGITDAELQKCKRQILDTFEMALDDLGERNCHLGRGELFRSSVVTFENVKKYLNKVAVEGIQDLARLIYETGISTVEVRARREINAS